jgi:hypothetical protein
MQKTKIEAKRVREEYILALQEGQKYLFGEEEGQNMDFRPI